MKNIIIMILSLGTQLSFAQNIASPFGSRTVFFDVQANVPQLCNISTADFSDLTFGTYYASEITKNKSLAFSCYNTAVVKLSVELGNNPKSTPEKRRLPLNGEAGDVEHYLTYKIVQTNTPTNITIGGEQDAEGIYYNGISRITLSFILDKQEKAPLIGSYSDTLRFNVEYW